MTIVFGPRRPIAIVGQPDAIAPAPHVTPVIVAQVPPPPQAYGLGLGSATIRTAMPELPPPVTPIIPARQFSHGSYPPARGSFVSSRGGVNTVDTTPRVVPPAVARREEPRPYSGFAVTRSNQVNPNDQITPISPPAIAKSFTPQPLQAYGLGFGSAVIRGNVTDLIPPPPPAIISRIVNERFPLAHPGSALFSSSTTPTREFVNVPVIIVPAGRYRQMGLDGSAITIVARYSAEPGPSELFTPAKSLIFQRHGTPDYLIRYAGEGFTLVCRDVIVTVNPTIPVKSYVYAPSGIPDIFLRHAGYVWTRHGFRPTLQPPLVDEYYDVIQEVTDSCDIGDDGTPQNRPLFFIGDVRRWQIEDFTRDGSAWAITSATLVLVNPAGTATSYTATRHSATRWYYNGSTSTLATKGMWRRYWILSDGIVTLRYGPVRFVVREVT